MIAILAALLHNNAIEAADVLCTPVSSRTGDCILSQEPNSHYTIHNLYDFLSSFSQCIEHTDNTQIPSNKNVYLRMHIYKLQQRAHAPECDRLPYLSPCPAPDGDYYVFGLRKIIV
ncbi:MAG: hypothetical protein LUE99_02855 [Bacteroides sp.]|nr:hypothetical protein [Bacteroides sp.]